MPERNLPSKAGAALGREIARLTPVVPSMCRTCAFRLGTYPNRCTQTVMAAVGCVVGQTPFHCHEHTEPDGTESICEGFMSAIRVPDWGENL